MITTHSYETSLQKLVISGPHSFFSDNATTYRILHETPWGRSNSTFPVTMTAQCASERVAERMLRNRGVEVVDTREFMRFLDRIDFSFMDVGKVCVLDNIHGPDRPWHELREWINDSLIGDVSVFLNPRMKRLSFRDDGDYALFRLAWG